MLSAAMSCAPGEFRNQMRAVAMRPPGESDGSSAAHANYGRWQLSLTLPFLFSRRPLAFFAFSEHPLTCCATTKILAAAYREDLTMPQSQEASGIARARDE